MRRRSAQAGFSLLEALVAMAITAAVTSGLFAVLAASRGLADVQPESADMQQRLRAGVDLLAHDLRMAGAGAYLGKRTGPLIGSFAPVLPFRRGLSEAYDDGPGVFSNTAITMVYVPLTAAQTTIRAPLFDPAVAQINIDAGCPANDPVCGFREGSTVAIYDGTGAFDLFSVTGTDPSGSLVLQLMQQGGLATTYAAGSKIVEVTRHSYFFDRTGLQLMRYDGLSASTVVLDNVAGFDVEYFGDPEAPAFVHPGVDRSVSYGPAPPAIDETQGTWPPGENCMWATSGGQQVSRLSAIGDARSGLVRLGATQLSDGPWCPDAASVNRFDADLLRIRRVRITVRVQTGDARLRASAASGRSGWFVSPGTAVSAASMVPDRTIRFDVSPRNMSSGR
jgi:hypothetical protein